MFSVNFCGGITIKIDCPDQKKYRVLVYDGKNLIFDNTTQLKLIKIADYNDSLINRFIDYKVEIFLDGILVFSEKINLNRKKVKINFDSKALGDNIAWISQVSRFQKIHNCEAYVNCHYKELFEKVYPNLRFIDAKKVEFNDKDTIIPGMKKSSCKNFFCFFDLCHCYYATYDIGFYSNIPKLRTLSLAEVASEILGMDYEEVTSDIFVENYERLHKNRYVCISVQSTAQYKYWNNKNGWQSVSDYLMCLGYDVICIDLHDNFGKDGFTNSCPEGVINKTGNIPLQQRITDILHCDFFIGLASGLSWLAWALKKPVIMISGFSHPKTEFSNDLRVFNSTVCNSCWNDVSLPQLVNKGWNYCPRNNNYECSTEITAEMVIEKINKCILDNNLVFR